MARPIRLSAAAGQHLLAGLALLGFLAGTLGVPLPRIVHQGKDRSQPFPCMDRACGCQTAAQCWTGCCCFTDRQKVAWAERHEVEVPAFVIALAAREPSASVPQGDSCPDKQGASACCDEDVPDCCEQPAAVTDIGAMPRIDFVLAIQARKCQGQAELWLTLGAAPPLPARTDVEVDLAPCGAAHIAPQWLTSLSLLPATPPPKA